MGSRFRARRLGSVAGPAVLVVALALGTSYAANAGVIGFGSGGTVVAPTFNASVRLKALAEDSSGRIVAAGSAGPGFGVVRYRGNGSVDQSFAGDGIATTLFDSDAQAEGLAIQSDGKIVAAGFARDRDGGIAVARYNADGSRDREFAKNGRINPPASQLGLGFDVALQNGGRILVAGMVHDHTPQRQAVVIGYTPDGRVDRSFGDRGRVRIGGGNSFSAFTALKLLPDGKILAAGYFRKQLLLVRLTADGHLDRGFAGGDGKLVLPLRGNRDIGCPAICDFDAGLGVQPGGRIVVQADSGVRIALARFSRDGRIDRSFGRQGLVLTKVGLGLGSADGMAVDKDGRIVVASGSEKRGRNRFTVLRYKRNGRLDPSFASHGVLVRPIGDQSAANAVLVLKSGSVLVGGNTKTGQSEAFVLIRLPRS
jgi:uncharacterized delta-60 repeat protein